MSDTHPNYIAGAWVDATSHFSSLNPSDTSDTLGRFARAEAADIDNAVEAARNAARAWQRLGPEARQNEDGGAGVLLISTGAGAGLVDTD